MKKRFLPKKETGLFKKILFWILTISIGIGFLGAITLASFFIYLSVGLPDVTDLENLTAAQSTEIFDREGNLLYTIHGEENREQTSYENISQYVIDATIAIEDDEYWEHPGFDLLGIGRAVMYEAFGFGTPRGGSTITQQYIKNTFLTSEHSYSRKAKELILAVRLEKAYDKEKILELYLNRIPYGNNAYGIQKAAEVYFNKDAKDLNLAESIILASLPQAPSRYNPYGDNKFTHLIKEFTKEDLEKRPITSEFDLEINEYVRGLIGQDITLVDGTELFIAGKADLVLRQLYTLEKITESERDEAKESFQTLEFNNYRESIKHPHFVLYIKQILEDDYGKDRVEQGGLKVYTTIDPDIQKAAEDIAEEKGESNVTRFDTNNMAVLTINAKTGEILAMLGSRDYFNEEIDGNVNIVLRPRQPGSSFKPFVYAQAFYNGYAPSSVVHDIPTKLGSNKPQNYDGKWLGQITLRTGLGLSRNIPAIKAYFIAGEQDDIIDLVTKMGITTLDKNYPYGYPLALGSGEVPLMQMVQAYAVFANNGKKPELTGISKIESSNGDIIYEWEAKEPEEVMDPQIAYLINSILSDQSNSVGPNLFIPGKINAAKTGTSTKESKTTSGKSVQPSDAWTIGYSPSIVTGVWTGNTDGKGLAYNANGYDTAAPIFRAVMIEALKNEGKEPFPMPEGIKSIEISKASGKLPSANTPKSLIVTDIFPNFSVPTEEEQTFFKVKIDKISGLLATEFTPEEAIQEVTYQNYQPIADMLSWASEVESYYRNKSGSGTIAGGVRIGTPPTEYDNVHTAATENSKPVVTIISPSSNTALEQGAFKVNLDIFAANGVQKVEYFIDDKLEYFTTTSPYTGHLNISRFIQKGTSLLIVAKVIDDLGYSSQSAIKVKVAKDGEGTLEIPEKEKKEKEPEITPELIPEIIPQPTPAPLPIPEPTPTPEPLPTPVIPESTSIFDT